MKLPNLTFALICWFVTPAIAQFNLKGEILNYDGRQQLQVNIPLVYGLHPENTKEIPIGADGRFEINLPITNTTFASLILNNKKYALLLEPGKNLALNINYTNNKITYLSGSALSTHLLMQQIAFKGYTFFLNDHADNEMYYSKFTYQQVIDSIINPYLNQQAEKIKTVQNSAAKTAIKKIITEEINYYTTYLFDIFVRTANLQKQTQDSLILKIFANSKFLGHPEIPGSSYYNFLESYLEYLEKMAFLKAKADKIPPNKPLPIYGFSLDSGKTLAQEKGKDYISWIAAVKNLPNTSFERYFYQKIVLLYYEKNLAHLRPLATAFQSQFKKSIYLKDITTKVDDLKQKLQENEKNESIIVVDGYENINSIYDVVKELKGKVIYLDIWGTWCGPCKQELRYVPELKAKFKNKDVAFVYLDMDDDKQDAIWKQFMKINQMEGYHIRKNRKNIQPFWDELLADAVDKQQYYPQYFIFDKEGKLVVTKAKRPSDKEELYKQIEKYLN